MAIVKTNDIHYKNIAQAIRQQTGRSDTYTPEELPDGIEQVRQKGYDEGYMLGMADGHIDGLEVGEKQAQQRFWENYQMGGARTDYNFAFAGAGWTNEMFCPQHDIHIINGYQMFAYSSFEGSLKKHLENCGVSMTFSGNGTFMNLFGYAEKITELGVIDLSSLTSLYNTHIFNQCKALKTIERLVVPNGQAVWTYWFAGCAALETVIFDGIIYYGGLDLSESPNLSVESLRSLLNALADKTGSSGTAPKLTLGTANLAKLSDSDRAIATNKGWTLV